APAIKIFREIERIWPHQVETIALYANDDDGTSTEAVTWCTECEVLLCTGCEKHHTKSKASKDHKTMSTKDYHNLPKFMLEISSQCQRPQQKV
ncbi:Hypothetical predicted protein, partial [Mytilus galloprovincialis]